MAVYAINYELRGEDNDCFIAGCELRELMKSEFEQMAAIQALSDSFAENLSALPNSRRAHLSSVARRR